MADLFEAAAERIAYEGGRNVNQVRIELEHGDSPELPWSETTQPFVPTFPAVELEGDPLAQPWYSDVLGAHVPNGASVYKCEKCGATFVTRRANATTCNLCRRKTST